MKMFLFQNYFYNYLSATDIQNTYAHEDTTISPLIKDLTN